MAMIKLIIIFNQYLNKIIEKILKEKFQVNSD